MTPKTAVAGTDTKDRLLEAAVKLMLKNGYTATSVDEICEAARLTKGSFFHYFESKEALGKAAVRHFYGRMKGMFAECDFTKEADPLKRVYGYIDAMIDFSRRPDNPPCCLIGNFAQELADTHPAVRDVCAECFDDGMGPLKAWLAEAKAKHAPRAGFDTDALADYFTSLTQGTILLAKATQDRKLFVRNLTLYKQHLKALFGK